MVKLVLSVGLWFGLGKYVYYLGLENKIDDIVFSFFFFNTLKLLQVAYTSLVLVHVIVCLKDQ